MKDIKQKWLINQLYDISDRNSPKQLLINHTEFSVLAAICKGAKNNSIKSKMGYARIHRLTGGISKNTIIRSIKSMRQKNIITVHISIKSNQTQDDSEYEIHLENVCKNNTKVIFGNEGGVPTVGRGGVPTMAPLKALSKSNYQKQKLLDNDYDQSLSNVLDIPIDAHFEDFWACYPRKEGKQKARAIWIREKLDSIAEEIIDDVRQRQIRHDRWEDRSFIPHCTTYLNGAGWKDEIVERRKITSDKKEKFNSGVYLVDEVRKSYENQRTNSENIFDVSNYLSKKVD